MLITDQNMLADCVVANKYRLEDFTIKENKEKTVTHIIHNTSGLSFIVYNSNKSFTKFAVSAQHFVSHTKIRKEVPSLYSINRFPLMMGQVHAKFDNWLAASIRIYNLEHSTPNHWKTLDSR